MATPSDSVPGPILIIDDDAKIGEFISQVATTMRIPCVATQTATAFHEQYALLRPSLVVLDMQLGDTDGIELIRFLSAQQYRAPLLLISGLDIRLTKAAGSVAKAHGMRVVDCLQKPFSVAVLREALCAGMGAEATEQDAGSLFGELHRAIEQGELTLYFQPKVELKSGRIAGAEALVRWQHPEKGTLAPIHFIPVAEKTGLIIPLTRWVLKDAIRHIAAWRSVGHLIPISVNIPAELLNDLDFPQMVMDFLDRHAVAGELLCLEFTETGAMQDIVTAVDVLARLRIKGLSLSIDDFGTGYSSLAKLHRMPFNEVKIDRAFVWDLDVNQDSRIIAETIVRMAHSLRMSVTAEGVETQSVWGLLAEAGCDLAQGYFISRPLAANAFLDWVGNRPAIV